MTNTSREILIEKLNRYIHQSATKTGTVGHLAQEQYRGDLFKLFEMTVEWKAPPTGNALLDALERRWPLEDGTDEFLLRYKVCAWWDEWRYAFSKCAAQHEDAIAFRDDAIQLIYRDTLDRTEQLISRLATICRERAPHRLALTAEQQRVIDQAKRALLDLKKLVRGKCSRRSHKPRHRNPLLS